MLTNLETSTEKLLQIVLSGQPELEEKLNLPQLRQLRQRITLRCKTHPLTGEETRFYIAQRLKIAGSNGHAVFSPEALAAVHKYAGGIPRVINLLCDHALISAFADQQAQVSADTIEAIAREFDLLQPLTPPPLGNGERQGLMETLQDLASLTERLRRSQKLSEAPTKGSYEPNS
jgi:general secretion pathway protein A